MNPQTGTQLAPIAAALREALDAPEVGVVDVSPTALATYSTDASNYRHVPLAVVTPRSDADVLAVLHVARDLNVPVLPRGAGTSIGGQATNAAVVLDFTRHLNRVQNLDASSGRAQVQPGVILDRLRKAASIHDLTFGPDPSTHSRCTLGGMIGNNACGSHSVAWGKTDDNIQSLDVALVDGTRFSAGPVSARELESLCARADRVGEVHRSMRRIVDEYRHDIRTGIPELGRRVSGYSLDALLPENGFNLARALVGTEGTCVTVLGATVDLVHAPRSRALCVLGFPNNVAAADAVPAFLDFPVLTVEGIDVALVAALQGRNPNRSVPALPEGRAWLYIETGGDTLEEAVDVARTVAGRGAGIGASQAVVTDPLQQRALWQIREEGAGLATRLADGSEAWPGWEDAAVPPERLGGYLRDFESLMQRHDRRGIVYGHFGDGCLHVRIDFPFRAPDGRLRYRAFMEEAAGLVVSHGGSLSGEHGDGQARAELLPKMYSPRMMQAFAAFKSTFDPDNLMNPHRIVEPARLDENLRPMIELRLLPESRLALTADKGDLGAATRRCVGVAKCVTDSGGVMCPSYRATKQEEHSTRGRARLLFEMLAGDVVTEGWQADEVHDALDLCLGCKGCKTDCPVGVDMATYKVEFLSRYYEGRRRPTSHLSMGALPHWLRAGSRIPRLVNALTRSPLSGIMKRIGGVAAERSIPELAASTMRDQLRPLVSNGPTAGSDDGRPQLVLLPDTFTNHFDSEVGADAAAVLTLLGYDVVLPRKSICCGLTWYSTGQLETATKVVVRTLDILEPWLDAGVPIIGLEPSCTAMLKHDIAELLPGDSRALRLSATLQTFAERLNGEPRLPPAQTNVGEVLTQVHCHQYADLGFDADRNVLQAIGAKSDVIDGGCCGLAGNFGFERGHYDVSVACAEQKLLPALRSVSARTGVHADGFSCRTQIRQLSGHEPVHLATLVARAWGLRAG